MVAPARVHFPMPRATVQPSGADTMCLNSLVAEGGLTSQGKARIQGRSGWFRLVQMGFLQRGVGGSSSGALGMFDRYRGQSH